jgi:hypothetical protein
LKELENHTVKKGSRVSRPQPGCHFTTKLSLGGNNDVITELFLPRGSLVSDIPAEDGKLVNLFYGALAHSQKVLIKMFRPSKISIS